MKQAAEVDNRFASYLPRLAIEWASDAPRSSWRAIDGTLVFVDISGFTALSERLARRGPIGAEELTEVLSRSFAELLAIAYADGGSLLKFGGDALLLLFDGEGHVARAVRAALRMRATMRTVGQLATTVGNIRLRMSVGIHTGQLNFFRVGRSHKELIIGGPGATATVLMEGIAEAGEIVVSEAVASAIDGRLVGKRKADGWLLRNRAQPDVPLAFPPVDRSGRMADAIPVALREYLAAGGADSEHRHASIAFVHFDGTDDLLAEHGASFVADALDELVADVQAAAEEHGVTFLASDIDKDGGKIILVAGVPRARGDDEGRLLRAVRRIIEGERVLTVRIGVNRGHVFAGEVGPPYRRTYTVMGDAVNLAARLMAKAEPGQILASAGVLELSRTAFALEELEPFYVKGKAKPVQAFAVGRAVGTQEVRRATELPLIGREPELAALVGALETARVGQGRLVELVGDVGVGKSRLLAELRSSAADAELRLVNCEQYESATPFFAIRHLVRAVLGWTPTDRIEAEEVIGRLARLDPELLPWSALVGDVLDVDVPDTEQTARLQPKFRRERTKAVVVDLLGVALPSLAVLAFEDVHWIDDASADVLGRLAKAVGRRPWLVCVTTRGDGGFEAPESASTLRLELSPMASADAVALVAAAARHPLPPHVRDEIVQRAGGNPLYLEELVRAASSGDGAESLPESLEGLVAAQIDSLPPTERRLLRYAGVLGSSFRVPELVAVVGGDFAESAPDVLDALGEFLEPAGDDRLRFRHRMFRDVAYGMLPFRRRQELHARAAEVIEASTGIGSPERAEILSLHFEQANRWDKCWTYARLAADRARDKYANIEAVTLYERAIASSRHVTSLEREVRRDTWKELAGVAMIAGLYGRSSAALGEARRLALDEPAEHAHLCFEEANLAQRQGRSTSSVRWISRGLRLVEGRADPKAAAVRASLQVMLAYTRHQQGRPREAVTWSEHALEAASRSDNRSALASAYCIRDLANISLGRWDLATNTEVASQIFEEVGHFENQAIMLNALGYAAYFEGDWSAALEYYERARVAFVKIGNEMDAALENCNIAEIFADQGRLAEAEANLVAALTLWESLGFTYGLALARRRLAQVWLRQERVEEAFHVLLEVRQQFESYGVVDKVLEIDAWLCDALLRLGRASDATTKIEEVIARVEASGSTELLPMLYRLRAYAAAAQNRLVDAWAAIDASLDLARTRRDAYQVALALEAESVFAEVGGRTATAENEAERLDLLEQLGVHATLPPPVRSIGEGSVLVS